MVCKKGRGGLRKGGVTAEDWGGGGKAPPVQAIGFIRGCINQDSACTTPHLVLVSDASSHQQSYSRGFRISSVDIILRYLFPCSIVSDSEFILTRNLVLISSQ